MAFHKQNGHQQTQRATNGKVTTMTDLISRDDAIRALNGSCSTWEDDAKVQEIIMVLPSAEAVSREEYENIERECENQERVIEGLQAIIDNYKRGYIRFSDAYKESAKAVQLKQTDTLIIADALRYLAKDEERHLSDRTRADALREQILKYGASMCHSAEAVQGEWIMHIDDLFPCESTQECSVCHAKQPISISDDNFCPNCGAKMYKGGVDE